MSEEGKTVCWIIRNDQEKLTKFLAKHMGVSVSAIGRWAIDDALASLLARAGLSEADLPNDARRDGAIQAAK